jgi:protein SCO1/2
MRTTVWITMTIVVFGLLIGLQYRRMQTEPIDYEAMGYFVFDEPAVIPMVSLASADGPVSSIDVLRGEWVILFFGFTHCPDVCPTTMSILNLAIGDLEGAPRVAIITVDPERDSPEIVNTYARAFNESFVGFGGDLENIRTFANSLGIAFEKVIDDTGYSVEHSGALVVIDPEGNHRGYIRPPLRPENIHDIVAALMID